MPKFVLGRGRKQHFNMRVAAHVNSTAISKLFPVLNVGVYISAALWFWEIFKKSKSPENLSVIV